MVCGEVLHDAIVEEESELMLDEYGPSCLFDEEGSG